MSKADVTVHLAPFDAASELAAFCDAVRGAGAVASFIGLCRPASGGRAVRALTLDHFPGFTEAEIARIAEAAAVRFEVDAVRVAHRAGRVEPGDTIVFVAAASAHRRAAFDAVDFLMDYLKTEAPFWKLEEGEDGAAWIEPRRQDHTDKKRWEDS